MSKIKRLPIPHGFRPLNKNDTIMDTDLCDDSQAGSPEWIAVGRYVAGSKYRTRYHYPMIRAIKRRAAKAKRAGKPVKAAKRIAGSGWQDHRATFLGTHSETGLTVPVLVLPADAASVEKIRSQVTGALEPYAKFPGIAARAALAAIGIRA